MSLIVLLLVSLSVWADSRDSNTDALPDTASTDRELPRTHQNHSGQPAAELIPATGFPSLSTANQVSWAFDATPSDLVVHVEPFATMPLASNGQPARWNDLEYLGQRLFIADEQDGKIFEITDGIPSEWFDVATAIQSVTDRALSISNPFHGGLRGFAFHPDFLSNGKFYTSLMEERPANPAQHEYLSDHSGIGADSVLVEWTAINGVPAVDSYREVFRVGVPEYDHPIKQIAFNPHARLGDEDYGLLYIAHGDGSVASSIAGDGQGDNALGKILRINPLQAGSKPYSIPAANPFATGSNFPPSVYSYGHRNPHHLAFTHSGDLLAAEAGRDNIDEVNLIVAGANYGWSQREGAYIHLDRGTLLDGVKELPQDDIRNRYTYPVIQYGHTGPRGAKFTQQALGGGFVVENGSPLDGLYFYVDFVKTGTLFYASMRDIKAATTQGSKDQLTVAKSKIATVAYDHDNDPSTDSITMSLKDIIKNAPGYVNTNDRVDIRIGQGHDGALYFFSKRNSEVYRVINSLPGSAISRSSTTDLIDGKSE